MATNDLSKLLKTAKKTYGESVAKAKANSFTEHPDGKYIGLLVSGEVKMSAGKTPQWGLLLQWLIQEGDLAGESKYQWVNLFEYDDDDEISGFSSFAIQVLEAISGTDAEELDPEMVEQIVEDAVDEKQVWQYTLKTTVSRNNGNSYQNMRLNKRMEDYEPQEDTRELVGDPLKEEAPAKPAAKGKGKPAAEPEPEEEEEEEETTPAVKGDTVTFNVKVGKKNVEHTGTVTLVKGDTASVKEEDGTLHKGLALDDLTIVPEPEEEEEEEETEAEEEEEETTIVVGQEVTFTKDGKELTGTITAIDNDEAEADIKVGKKTYSAIPFSDIEIEADEDEEEEEEEEEGEELEIGTVVEFEDPKSKKQVQGKVISLDEEAGNAKVKVGALTKTVDFDDMVIIKA